MMYKLKSAWLIVGLMFIAAIAAYTQIDPSLSVPIHWNINGEVDQVASPLLAFFLIPTVSLLIVFIISKLHTFEPRTENIKQSGKAIHAIIICATILLAFVHTTIISSAFGRENINVNIVLACIGALIAVIGNYLPKIQSNFFAGIRTPWTLASDEVWRKTHRIGSIGLTLAGLLIFGMALALPAQFGLIALLGIIISMSLFIALYSWYLWRKEQKT